jgi:hypothetical protein
VVVWFVRTLDDEIRSQDTHGGDTDASLCGAVGGAEAGEDDGAGAAHRSEERLLFLVSIAVFPHSWSNLLSSAQHCVLEAASY